MQSPLLVKPVTPFRQWMGNHTLRYPLAASAKCSSLGVKVVGEEEIVNLLTSPVCPLTVAISAITYNLAFNWREKEVIRAPKVSAIRIVKTNPTQASILPITAKWKHEECRPCLPNVYVNVEMKPSQDREPSRVTREMEFFPAPCLCLFCFLS